MEALIHLVFTLFKIAFQAAGYAALLLGLARLLRLISPGSWLARQARQPLRFWQDAVAAFATALFLFSLTYWGSHGLGDYSRVPLGHGEAVELIEVTPYFEPAERIEGAGGRFDLDSFAVVDGVLCAARGHGRYFTYDLAGKQYREFADASAYHAYAAAHGLPRAAQFESFYAHYGRYWHGWRFWLLA